MHQVVKLSAISNSCGCRHVAAGALQAPRQHLRRLRRSVDEIRPYAPDAVEQTLR